MPIRAEAVLRFRPLLSLPCGLLRNLNGLARAPEVGRYERLCRVPAELLLAASSGSTITAVCCGCMMPLPFSSLQKKDM